MLLLIISGGPTACPVKLSLCMKLILFVCVRDCVCVCVCVMDVLSPNWPLGFRFHPEEDEIIDYLRLKITGNDEQVWFITELVKFCQLEPWDLLELSRMETKYPVGWFFSPPDPKHGIGNRSNRATNDGYWKVTCRDKVIMSGSRPIGIKKTLVFYMGRHPSGKKTDWLIHEYHTTLKELDGTKPGQNAFVLCRLSYKPKKSIKDRNFNDAGPCVSSPNTSKSCLQEAESELLLASVSEVQATTTISDTTTPVECGDNNFSAHAVENQLGEPIATEDDPHSQEAYEMLCELLQKPGDCNILPPFTSLHNKPAVSFPTTAKSFLEEFESEQFVASVSPASGEEAENYLPKCFPQENFDRMTSNTLALSNCNQNSYNAYTEKNRVPEAIASEFEEGLHMSDLDLPPVPLDCNLFCSFDFDMPKESSPLGMSPPVTNYLNNSHCRMFFQNATNEPAAYGCEFSDSTLDNHNVYFQNQFGSQNNLTFGFENPKNLVSITDNGSCSGSDAKIANAPFERTFQDSEEISKRKASSGLLNRESYIVSTGGSSNQIIGSDWIPKYY